MLPQFLAAYSQELELITSVQCISPQLAKFFVPSVDVLLKLRGNVPALVVHVFLCLFQVGHSRLELLYLPLKLVDFSKGFLEFGPTIQKVLLLQI